MKLKHDPLTPSNANAAGLLVAGLIKARKDAPSIRSGVFHMDDGRLLVAKIKKKSVTFTLEEQWQTSSC